MAVAKLGVVVSDLAGSIGGTTFKRNGSTLSVYNKTRGASKSKLLKNQSLLSLQKIRNLWKNLDSDFKLGWEIKATEVQFPNKFGDMVYLTPLQLFMKANGNLMRTGDDYLAGEDFSKDYTDFTIDSFDFDWGAGIAKVNILFDGPEQWFYFRFDIGTPLLNSPVYNRSVILYFEKSDVDFGPNLWEALKEKYGDNLIGKDIRVYISTCTVYGYRSTEKILNGKVS